MELVIPISEKNVETLQYFIPYWKEYLPTSHIVFLAKNTLKEFLMTYANCNIRFVDEDSLVSYQEVYNIISANTDEEDARKRTGWYLQQFLKWSIRRFVRNNTICVGMQILFL